MRELRGFRSGLIGQDRKPVGFLVSTVRGAVEGAAGFQVWFDWSGQEAGRLPGVNSAWGFGSA